MRVRTHRFLATTAAGLILVLMAVTPAAAAPGAFRPGAPGVGDPYFPNYGNGGYDVQHYDLDIRYNPATDQLTGHAVILAKATQGLSRFNLDLVGLTVDSITVDGRAARWSRTEHELRITPARNLPRGQLFVVDARYHGVPATFHIPGTTLEAGFIPTDDGAVVAGEPEVAAFWYPVNDHPLDKATYTFSITVPKGLEAIANGVPLGSSTSNGWTTWKWAEHSPMISYLATATIGDFRVKRSFHNGRPMVIAIDKDLPPKLADDALGRTGEITDFLAGKFGPYPFDANGGIVSDYDNLFFALENQTRTVYSKFFFDETTTTGETYVVAHELAHQWYGDSVGVHFWKNVWLNEGFATYAEWLWSEHLNEGTPQEIFDFLYEQPIDAGFWGPPPGDPGVDDLFGASVYVRGAMTLQALRMTVGDAKFFRILRTWYAEHRDGNGSTPQFVALAERISGKQLDKLFHDWLFTATKPARPGGAAAKATVPTAKPNALRSLDKRIAAGFRG